MRSADIAQVVEVDRESYPVPWPASAYRRELNNNQHARYIVLREVEAEMQPPPEVEPKRGWTSLLPWTRSTTATPVPPVGRIVGYAGMWLVSDEAHITTIAVRNANRGSGFGELLLASLVGSALDLGVRWVTLEVRMSNDVAQQLYVKYGFRKAGVRKNYYSDNNEDALIMTTDDITLDGYRTRFRQLVARLEDQLAARVGPETNATVLSQALT